MFGANWRLFIDSPASGAENMARDHALMERAVLAGEWTLRVYAWRTPTISLGRNQTARGRYDLERIHARGIAVVRRPTGGRAILHDREITYSVTAPVADAGDLRRSYALSAAILVLSAYSAWSAATVSSAARCAAAQRAAPSRRG